VFVLCKGIGQSVTDKNRLEVDVALLVRQDLRGEDGDIMTSVRFTRNVEILFGVLGELFEKQSEESVDILASGNGVADGSTTV